MDIVLENGQRIHFNFDNLKNQIENPRNNGFKKKNRKIILQKMFLYDEIPLYYIFDKQNKIFNKRRCKIDGYVDIFQENIMGCVYTRGGQPAACEPHAAL